MHRVTDVISAPAGFRRHLRNVFHRYRQNTLYWQASDHTDDFMNQRIECYVNNATNLRPIHYVMLYPQDDNRIVAVDSVTDFTLCISLLPTARYSLALRKYLI